MSLANVTARMLARHGRPFTLRRLPSTDVTVQGFRGGFDANNLPGGLPQGQSTVIIGNAEIAAAAWPGPPRKGDRLIEAARTAVVESIETIWLGTAIDRHVLTVTGG